MHNYYRLLSIGPGASAAEIEQAYVRQRTRLLRLARADRAMKARLADVEIGYSILANPRRRVAYDLLLAQEPPETQWPIVAEPEEFPRATRISRSLNAALLACTLVLGLDWALPLKEYRNELVRSRFRVSIASPLSDPQIAYRVRTPHSKFRLPSNLHYRVREGHYITVWQTPLLGVVQRISSPTTPGGPAPFQPYGGTIYGIFAVLPLLMGIVSAVGVWPSSTPETIINTAAVSGLLALIALAVLLVF
jgi:hypothetical protein